MSIWRDLKRYRTGRTPEGYDTFSIPLTPDEEGMVGRECHSDDCQPKYFKIYAGKSKLTEEQEGKEGLGHLYCPYCGHRDHISQFATTDQIEWVKSLFFRDISKAFDDMMRNAVRSKGTSTRGGFFSVRLEYKPGILPSVRHYAEKELQRVAECNQCSKKYAVYGIAMFCPWCGKGNLRVHLTRSIEIIQSLMDSHNQIVEKVGKEAGHYLLCNCLEDCVSLFEGFLKVMYGELLKQNYGSEQRIEKMNRLHNSFQNLSKANKIFIDDLNIDIFSGLSSKQFNFMCLQFAKRHVITHNLGLVDEKFKEQAHTWQTTGEDIDIDSSDIEKLLELIEKVIKPIIP